MRPITCIILPTYNEVENIRWVVRAIFAQSEKIDSHDLHILVVDDDSPDGTHEEVRRMMGKYTNLHLITGEKKGLGEAYKRGMAYAISQFHPDLIFEMDADRQHDPEFIPIFNYLATHGFSLVIGSRFAPGGSTPNFSLRRKAISLLGNWMIRFLGGIPRIHDCTSGFRCIKASLIPRCNLSFLSTRGYSFQSSLLCELLRNGAKVIEVPIIFPDRIYGESKLSFKDQIEFLFNLAKIRFRQSEEFVKYCIVGVSGILVNLGMYITLTRLLYLPPPLSSPIAIETSIISNFFLNHLWTFNGRHNAKGLFKKITNFHIVAGIAGLSNYSVFILLINYIGLYDIIANLTGIALGTLINYFCNSLWTWRRIRADGPAN
ncbi:glycosyl transferase [Desulfosarcina widdelii]|uniref:Glycosyl transferase n=1 Tax=Desulfosarcina widdelii TaxID=947919 RepID=A0A5K7YXC8_9BACT|nr:glycosyltransferase family 2 protein [Desulfosarcina widdelii]BBO73268.1 glycosyl transferase [Desulfosarcina widdelii]